MAGLIRIVVATRDHARLDALHERAQCCEIGARVGARRRQRELLDPVGDGALLSPKRVLKQMITSQTTAVNRIASILIIKRLSDNNN